MSEDGAIQRRTYRWGTPGEKPPEEGDEVYAAGEQPVAEWDNWMMRSITADLIDLDNRLVDHSHFHESGGEDELDLDGLGVGQDPNGAISESTSPKSFTFTAGTSRDVHTKTTVHVSNASGSSVTEDVTVALYDGTDTSGTPLESQQRSIDVADGDSKLRDFLESRRKLDTGEYHIEVTQSGSTLSIDQTDEHAFGGRYVTQESGTGDLELADHAGVYARRDAISGDWKRFPAFDTDVELRDSSLTGVANVNTDEVRARDDDLRIRTSGTGSGSVSLYDETNDRAVARAREDGAFEVPNGSLSVEDDIESTDGVTVWDGTSDHVPQESLENDAVNVSYDSHLSGDGQVSLGGTLSLSVNDDFVKNTGDTMSGDLDMGGNDLEDGGTTVWDASAEHVPQSRLQNDSVTVSAGAGLSGGGSLVLGGSVNLSVRDDYVKNTGDSMSGDLSMSGNDITDVTQADVGGITGSESTFQGASNQAGSGHLNVPWVYASAIEAHTERGGSSTAIEMGADGSNTDADEIALVTQGNVNLLVDSNNDVQVSNKLDTSSGGFVLPKRSSDPSNAEVGQLWYRTDLD